MGLISRVSSRTYRYSMTIQYLTIFLAFVNNCLAADGVTNLDTEPGWVADLNFRDGDFPMLLLILVGVGIGLIATVYGIVYMFSQEDPSKTNIVYKLSYSRLKTE